MKHQFYYKIKPMIPRWVQIEVRKLYVSKLLDNSLPLWPIQESAGKTPADWTGWPGGKKFAFILTHDVEKSKGQDKVKKLMNLEIAEGYRSSYNFVPERYAVSKQLREELIENGFEVGVHGLNHDGKLFSSKAEFLRRAVKINGYLKEWNACGFRAPSMHHNLQWMKRLNILYDASTFDTDPFEPQSDGAGTVFPFIIKDFRRSRYYVELPYTLAQDFTLFVLMKQTNIDIWKRKIDWIASKGGMALVNVHPDYVCFGGGRPAKEEFPADYYVQLLRYVKENYKDEIWHALPREAAEHTLRMKNLKKDESRRQLKSLEMKVNE